jgi:glutamine cyclotransferase
LYGQSEVRIVDIQTGTVLDVMDPEYFGEGLATPPSRVKADPFTSTYHALIGFIYDADTQYFDSFRIPPPMSEGWDYLSAEPRDFSKPVTGPSLW